MINPSSREDWSLLGESVSLASDSSPATSSSARRCSASAIARTPLPSPLGQTESLCRQISYASSLIGSDLPISACTNVSLPAPGSLSLSDLATPSRLTEGSRLMSPTERSDAFDKERETWIMAPQAAWEALHKRLADLEAQVTALQSAVYDSTQHDDRDLRSFGDGASSQRDSRPDDKVDHQPVVHESLNLDSPGRRPVSSPLTVQRL